jgi:hypothetical protein
LTFSSRYAILYISSEFSGELHYESFVEFLERIFYEEEEEEDCVFRGHCGTLFGHDGSIWRSNRMDRLELSLVRGSRRSSQASARIATQERKLLKKTCRD